MSPRLRGLRRSSSADVKFLASFPSGRNKTNMVAKNKASTRDDKKDLVPLTV